MSLEGCIGNVTGRMHRKCHRKGALEMSAEGVGNNLGERTMSGMARVEQEGQSGGRERDAGGGGRGT